MGRRRARRPTRPVAASAAMALCAAVAVVLPACGDDQPAYCAELDEVSDLKALSAAVADEDPARATREMDRFLEVAEAAPPEIRDDMVAIAEALREVVTLGTTAQADSATDQERRRNRANQQLAGITDHTAAVSAWAEERCGIRFD